MYKYDYTLLHASEGSERSDLFPCQAGSCDRWGFFEHGFRYTHWKGHNHCCDLFPCWVGSVVNEAAMGISSGRFIEVDNPVWPFPLLSGISEQWDMLWVWLPLHPLMTMWGWMSSDVLGCPWMFIHWERQFVLISSLVEWRQWSMGRLCLFFFLFSCLYSLSLCLSVFVSVSVSHCLSASVCLSLSPVSPSLSLYIYIHIYIYIYLKHSLSGLSDGESFTLVEGI